jgi:chromosome segregation ATPase
VQEKIECIESEASELQTTMNTINTQLQMDLDSSNAKVSTMLLEQETMKHRLESLTEIADEKTSHCLVLESRIIELSSKQLQHLAQLERLETEVERLRSQMDQETDEHHKLEESYNSRLSEVESERDSLVSEVKLRKLDVEALEQAVSVIESRLKQKKLVEAELTEIQKTLDNVIEERDNALQQVEQVESEFEKFREEAQAEIANVDEQLESEKSEKEKSKLRTLELQLQLETLTKSFDSIKEEGTKNLTSHKAELAELKRSMLGMVSEREEIIQNLKIQLGRLTEASTASSTSAETKIQESSVALKEALDRERANSGELAKIAEKMKKETSRRESADENLRISKEEMASLKKEVKALRTERDQMKDEVEKTMEEARIHAEDSETHWKSTMADKEKETDGLKYKLVKSEQEKKEAETKLEKKRAKIEKLKRIASELQARPAVVSTPPVVGPKHLEEPVIPKTPPKEPIPTATTTKRTNLIQPASLTTTACPNASVAAHFKPKSTAKHVHQDDDGDSDYDVPSQSVKTPEISSQRSKYVDTPIPRPSARPTLSGLPKKCGLNWGAKSKASSTKNDDFSQITKISPKSNSATSSNVEKKASTKANVETVSKRASVAVKAPETERKATPNPARLTRAKATTTTSKKSSGKALSDSLFNQDDDPFEFQ